VISPAWLDDRSAAPDGPHRRGPEGGYSDTSEIICCDCGDHPDLDYCEVSPELQRVRGPYPIADGIEGYEKHIQLHRQPGRGRRAGPVAHAGYRR